MHHRPVRFVPARRPVLLSAALLALAGCGGGAVEPPPPDPAAPGRLAAPVVATLLDDEGRINLTDPAAVPADSTVRTRAGRYATAAQAEQLERALEGRAIAVDVSSTRGDTGTALTQAEQLVWGLQAARDLPYDAPVLVSGAEPRLAAALADRLDAQGYRRVFLVAAP